MPEALTTCTAEDRPGIVCGRPTVAHGLCSKHARRLQRNGDTELRRAPNGTYTECAADGCDRPRKSPAGFCHMHYARVQRTGEPGPPEPLPRAHRRSTRH